MGKAAKIILITAGILIITGIIISIIGYSFLSRRTVSAETYEKKESTITDSFDSITIDEVSADVRIVPSADGTTKVEYYDSERMVHKINVNSGTLEISVNDTSISHWWDYIANFDWTFRSFDNPERTTTLYLPVGSFIRLNVDGVSSDIKVSKEFTFEKIKFNTTSGDIATECVVTDSYSVNTTSGDLSAGNIDLATLDVSTVSGSVTVNDSKIARKLDISTTSGDVTLNNVAVENASVNTVSGDVKGTLIGDHHYETDTVSGDIKLPSNIEGAPVVNIDTVSGDITFS